MATGRSYVGDLRTKRESAFGTTETGAFVGHRVTKVDLKGLQVGGKFIEDESTVDYAHDELPGVRGTQRGSTWSMDEDIEGLATPLDAAASFSSPNCSTAETFKAAFGDTYGAAGSAITGAGSTLSTLDVTGGQGSRFQPSQLILVPTLSGPGGTLQLELALVRKVTTDTLHLWWNLASIPSAAATVYNSETCALLITGVGIDSHSIYAEWIGEDSRDQAKIRGCAPTLDIVGDTDKILQAQVKWLAATAAVGAHGLTLGQTVPAGGGPKPITKKIVYYGNATGTDSAATRGVLGHEDVTNSPGLSLQSEEGDGTGSVEGVYSHQQMRARPRSKIKHTAVRDSPTWLGFQTDYAAGTRKYYATQYGTQVAVNGKGGVFAYCMPECEIVDVIARGESNRFVDYEVTLGALPGRSYTGGTANRVKSLCLAAFF